MGFDVLAFESGLYDCRRAWRAFKDGDKALSAARLGVFGIWTGSKQTGFMWQYLSDQSNTERPLELAGFDCQFTASASRKLLMGDLRELARQYEFTFGEQSLKQIRALINGEPKEGDEHRQFLKDLKDLRVTLLAADDKGPDAQDRVFWIQQLKSMIAYAEYTLNKQKGDSMASVKKRDAQMADNLVWLANKYYANRKIIVWAASFHIARNLSEIEVPGGSINYEGLVQMGHLVDEALGDQVFTVGFTAYEGQAGAYAYPPYPVHKAPEGTFEDACVQAGLQNALVPLREFGLSEDGSQQEFFSRPLGYKWMKSKWSQNFDAMVFNRVMKPSTR